MVAVDARQAEFRLHPVGRPDIFFRPAGKRLAVGLVTPAANGQAVTRSSGSGRLRRDRPTGSRPSIPSIRPSAARRSGSTGPHSSDGWCTPGGRSGTCRRSGGRTGAGRGARGAGRRRPPTAPAGPRMRKLRPAAAPGHLEGVLVAVAIAIVIVGMIVVEPGEVERSRAGRADCSRRTGRSRPSRAVRVGDAERGPLEPRVERGHVRPENRPALPVVGRPNRNSGSRQG